MKIEENKAKPTGNIEQWRTCSPNQKYIYLGHLQTWVPPHPPRVWKIGILQEMSRNSIIPDIDRDNCLASRKIFSAITLAKHPF